MNIIRIIDFETTGMEPPAEVIEVGYCDIIDKGDGWRLGASNAWLCGASAIPPEVRAVHHIQLDEVIGLEPFDRAAMWSEAKAHGVAIVAAHNLDFEAKFWGEHGFHQICTYKAALRAWPTAPSHSNGALRYWLQDQGKIHPQHEKTLPPHRAGPDAYVTAWILLALLRTEKAADMVRWTKEPRVLPNCPLGKFRGKPWPEVETGFLSWMLNQPTMEADLKWNARRELDRRRDVV